MWVFEDSAPIKEFHTARGSFGKGRRLTVVFGRGWGVGRDGLGFRWGLEERKGDLGQKWHPDAQKIVFHDVVARLSEILLA